MSDFQQEYLDLLNEISVGSAADGELKVTEFFRIFSDLSAENGDSPDLTYSPVIKEGAGGYRIDGYGFDVLEDDSDASGDLYLAVSDFHQTELLPVINAKDVETLINGVERFFKYVASGKAVDELEEASQGYQLALLMHQYLDRIRRVRIIILTNAHLRTRKKVFDPRDIGSVSIHVNVFDIERYIKISTSGNDPVEVDFEEDFSGAVPCLTASTGNSGYQSYLFAMHGPVLASVFAAYGNRLLEQNVRTYLQARTSVNKGILRTISDEPGMFFAYNNGITATASNVQTATLRTGEVAISRIENFQIVNGGQTTASMLYARDGMKKDLSEVYVQVKLSVVDSDKLEDIVPRISEYANTQNKVSLADLASNSPIQVRIERLSKEVSVPVKAGALYATKWFYERARGQYRSLFAYKTPTEKKRLETEYPKDQLLEKTDLGKYELSFDARPHHVCEGAQKCFQRYISSVLSGMDLNSANETWFKRLVAKAILFRSLDKEVAKSDWYKSNRALKAQTIPHTVSLVANLHREHGLQIDLDRIWKDQEVPRLLLDWMIEVAKKVQSTLLSPPDQVRNPSEFAKREFSWTLYTKKLESELPREIADLGVRLEDFREETASGRRTAKQNLELDFEVAIAKLLPRASEIRLQAKEKSLLSPNNERALLKLETGRLNFNKTERNALKTLLERLGVSF